MMIGFLILFLCFPICILLFIAWYGARYIHWFSHYRTWIYSLFITVYCSFGIYYGMVSQTFVNSWPASAFLMYIIPPVIFVLNWWILSRLMMSSSIDESSELYDVSRSLLQGAIEHLGQGISVVDKRLRLVAWNQQYFELFDFPEALIQVGRPVADVIRYNADRGLCGPGDTKEHVRKRVFHLKRGTRHTSSRQWPDGRVIEVQGNPMPGGGFVMIFTDITAFREAQDVLKQANEQLEDRVHKRTEELEKLNEKLVAETQRTEKESRSKSRFLAAVSHDLMQPLNAARLFSSSLSEVAQDLKSKELAMHIESSLGAAEELIGDLLDISRLESGKLNTNIHRFALNDVLSHLNAEFTVIANQQSITFSMVPSSVIVLSDPKFLRRIIQNFLTNAFRYTPEGKVVLGVRHCGKCVRVDIWDNGSGIEESQQKVIFEEFTRRSTLRSDQGLGLGLAISKGLSHILGHSIEMHSWPGKGSVFSLVIKRAYNVDNRVLPEDSDSLNQGLIGMRVLCVDNEESILEGMKHLLEHWGCDVRLAVDLVTGLQCIDDDWVPDVIFSDYRLENDLTGLTVLQQCRLRLGRHFDGIIISADRTQDTIDTIRANDFYFLPKPIKPLKLRAILNEKVHRR